MPRMTAGFKIREGSQGVCKAWLWGVFTEGVEGVEGGEGGTSNIHDRVWYRVAMGFLAKFAQ